MNDPIVGRESLSVIHDSAVRILAELGIRTDHAGMRDRLAGRGCRVEGERVCIPAALVAATLESIPPTFAVCGRSIANCITLGGADRIYRTNTGIMPNIRDLDSGQVRRSTLADVQATTRLLDAMEHVDAVYVSLVDATELEPHMVTVSDLAAVVANTTKPLIGPGLTNRAEAEAVVAIARAVRGGDSAELRRYPICVPFICPVSPLTFPADVVEALLAVAEAGLPLDIVSNPVMGLTAPYTIAGTVVLGHAEVLAAAVMAHTVSPGLPILNQNTPSVADMRTLASTTGGPETGLIRRTVVQLSRHLGIPSCAHGHTSSASLDWQAAGEKALNQLLIASARPALLGGLGGLANVTLTSYESIVLDNELYGAIGRILEGVQVDDDHLACDVIAELAETGNAMGSAHTVRHLRSSEVWQPALAERRGLLQGHPRGQGIVQQARAAARELLTTHTVEPLPEPVQAEIDGILAEYDRSCRRV